MTNVWCVRADFGTYTKQFVDGGYVAIGWMPNSDLSRVERRDELYPLYKAEHPDNTSNIVIGQQVGQIARFLLEIQAGDYVITRPPIPSGCTTESSRPTPRICTREDMMVARIAIVGASTGHRGDSSGATSLSRSRTRSARR